jgi:hypothetical protein
MLVKDPSILLHAKDFQGGASNHSYPKPLPCKPIACIEIASQDGLVGAATDDGKYIITSPNVKTIYNPPFGGDRSLFLRSNFRFGDDDELQWPQPFVKDYGHLCCIKRQPPPGDAMEVMWLLPQRADFLPDGGVLCGVGKLNCWMLKDLYRWVDHLFERATSSKFSDAPLVTQLVTTLRLLLYHLEFISATFRATQIVVRETQRLSLELRALLDFEELFRPRMVSATPHRVNTDIMGAFTTDLLICDALFRAGIPVWLIRPYTALASIRVRAVARLQFTPETIPLDLPPAPLPSIYVGPATSLDKYIAIARYVRRLLQFPDPFGSVRATALVNPPPSSAGPSSHKGSKSRSFTPCNDLYFYLPFNG